MENLALRGVLAVVRDEMQLRCGTMDYHRGAAEALGLAAPLLAELLLEAYRSKYPEISGEAWADLGAPHSPFLPGGAYQHASIVGVFGGQALEVGAVPFDERQ